MAAVPQAAVRLAVARRRHKGTGGTHVGHIHGKENHIISSMELLNSFAFGFVSYDVDIP